VAAWRAVVDSYWLLHPYYVLPMAVTDLFVNYMDYCRQHLLVRPGCNLPAGSLDFVPREKPDHWSTVGDRGRVERRARPLQRPRTLRRRP
jgi:hypothetical protein